MRQAVLFFVYGAMLVAAVLIVWLVLRHSQELEVENAQDVLTYFNERHIPRWERRTFYASLGVLLVMIVTLALWPWE